MRTWQSRGRRAAAFAFLWTAAALASAAAETRSGTIEILTADDFATGRAEHIVRLVSGRGEPTVLNLPASAERPAAGARVAVSGTPDGDRFLVESLEILEAAPAEAPAISGNTSVITILLKFLDTTAEPFTVAQVQDKMFGTGGTSAYYAEASYGTHTLSGVVTTWLTATINTPTTCDYIAVANQAEARAQAAGYNPGSYQKKVYIFPHLPCGWSGLGGGSQAWINQSLSVLVIGHELGHCFGLGHSSSLDCGTVVVGDPCTVSEYGDRFSIMGNSNARHFPANFKYQLGYLPPSTRATHTSGVATYTLSPIESPGGSLYAVQIPLPEYTYWLEYRQPIGFDASMTGNPVNGALVHLAPGYPAFSCTSCLLDMTPETDGFADAALEVGQTYADATGDLHVTPLSNDAQGLVVQVEVGPSPPFSVDRHATPPNTHPNGVLENGEVATVEPSWLNAGVADAAVTGSATSFTGPGAGATYTVADPDADYGTVAPAARASCFDATADCYAVTAFAPMRPATHWDASFQETLSDATVRTWPLHVGGSFADAPSSRADYKYVETVLHHGITSGCATAAFCPESSVTRAQMAVFLLRAEHGAGYLPPPATGQVFVDVPVNAFAASWIEQLAAEGITAGCGTGSAFCPNAPVTRAQMAVFLLKTEHGSAYDPPAASGDFPDVPVSSPFAPWVEALKDEGVTAGCGSGLYCPSQATRRGQMAVFLTKTFGLELYGP